MPDRLSTVVSTIELHAINNVSPVLAEIGKSATNLTAAMNRTAEQSGSALNRMNADINASVTKTEDSLARLGGSNGFSRLDKEANAGASGVERAAATVGAATVKISTSVDALAGSSAGFTALGAQAQAGADAVTAAGDQAAAGGATFAKSGEAAVAGGSGFVAAGTEAEKGGSRMVAAGEKARIAGHDTRQAGRDAKEGGLGFLSTSKFVLEFAGAFAAVKVAIDIFSGKQARDLEDTLKVIQNSTGLSNAAMKQMRSEILTLGAEGPAKLDDIAKGFEHAANLGYRGADAMRVVKVSWEAAIGTGAKIEDTVNALGTAMKNFGEPTRNANKDMGILMAAAADGNIHLSDLVLHFSKIGEVAGGIHLKLGDASAAFSTLTKATGDAATAQTQMLGMLKNLVNPTAGAQKELAALAKTSGIDLPAAFRQFAGGQISLKQVLTDLRAATHGNASELLSLMGGMRGGFGTIALLGQHWKDYIKTSNDVETSSKRVKTAFDKMMDTPAAQFAVLKNKLNEIAIAIENGLLPHIGDLLKSLNGFLTWVTTNLPTAEKAFQHFGDQVQTAFKNAQPDIQHFRDAFEGVVKKQDWVRFLSDLASGLSGVKTGAHDAGVELGFYNDQQGKASRGANDFGHAVGQAFQFAMQGVGTSLKVIGTLLGDLLRLLADAVVTIKDLLAGVMKLFQDVVRVVTDLIHGQWTKAMHDMGAEVYDMFSIVGQVTRDVVKLFVDMGRLVLDAVVGTVKGIVRFFQGLYDDLVGHSIVVDLVDRIVALFTDLPGRLAGALASLVSTVLNVFKTLASDLGSWASSLGGKFLGWATGWGSKIASGITSEAGKIKNAVLSAVQGAANAAGDWLSHHNPLDIFGSGSRTAPSGSGGDRPSATLFGMPATSISPGPAYASGVPGGVLHEDFQSRVGAPFYLPGGKGADYKLVGLTRSGVGWTETWRTPNGGEFDFMHMASLPAGMHAGETEHGGYRAGTSGGRPGIDVPNPAYSTGPHLHFGANQAALNYIYRETGPRGWVPGPMTAPYGASGPSFSQFSGGSGGVPAAVGQYDVLIRAAAKKYGIDPHVLEALIMQESSGNRRAVSSAGAQGLTQIMPFNDRHLGITNPFDAKQSIRGGAQLLSEYLRGPAHGDMTLALAMYNAGPRNARAGMGYASQVEQRAAGYGPDLTQRGGTPMSSGTAASANRAANAPIPVPPEFAAIGKNFADAAARIAKLPAELQAGPMAALKKIEGEWSKDLAKYATDYRAENVRHALKVGSITDTSNRQLDHYMKDHGIHIKGSLDQHVLAIQKIKDAEPIERAKEIANLTRVHNAYLTKLDGIHGKNADRIKAHLTAHETGIEKKLKDHINGLSGTTARHITSLDKSFGFSNSTQSKLLNEWLRNHKATLDSALKAEDALHGRNIKNLKSALDSHIAGLKAAVAAIKIDPGALWTQYMADLTKAVKDNTASMAYTAIFGKDQITTKRSAGTSRGAPTPQVLTTGDLTGQRGGDTRSTRTVVPTDLTAQRGGDVNAALGPMVDTITKSVVTVSEQIWAKAAAGAIDRAKLDAGTMVQSMMGGLVSLIDGKLSDFSTALGNVTTFLTSQIQSQLLAGKPLNDAYIATMAQVVTAQQDIVSISTAVSAKVALVGNSFSAMSAAASSFLSDTLSRWTDALTSSGSANNAWTGLLRLSGQAVRAFTDAQNHANVMAGQITNNFSLMSSGLQGIFSAADDDLKLFTANTGRASNGLYVAGGDAQTFGDKAIAAANNLGSLGEIINGLQSTAGDVKSQAETEFARTGSISSTTLAAYGTATHAVTKASWDQVAADLTLYKSTGNLKDYQAELGTEIGMVTDKIATDSKAYGVHSQQVIDDQKTLTALQAQTSALGDELKILGGDTTLAADAQAKATAAYQDFLSNGIDPAEAAAAAWGGIITASANDQQAYNSAILSGKSAVDQLSGSFLSTLIPAVKSLAGTIADAAVAIGKAILNINAGSGSGSGSPGNSPIASSGGQAGGGGFGGTASLPSYSGFAGSGVGNGVTLQGVNLSNVPAPPPGYAWTSMNGTPVLVPNNAPESAVQSTVWRGYAVYGGIPSGSGVSITQPVPPAPSTTIGTWVQLPSSTKSAYYLNGMFYMDGATLPDGSIVANGQILAPGTFQYNQYVTKLPTNSTPAQPSSNAILSSSLNQSAGEGSTFTGWSTGAAGSSVYYLNGVPYTIGKTLPDGTVVGANQQLLPQGSTAGNPPVSNRTWSSLGFNNSTGANSMLGQYGIASQSFWGLSLEQQRQQLISHGILGGPGGVTAGPFAPRPPVTPGTGTTTGGTAGTSASEAATISALTYKNQLLADTIAQNNMGLTRSAVSGGWISVLNHLGGRMSGAGSTPGVLGAPGITVAPGVGTPSATSTQVAQNAQMLAILQGMLSALLTIVKQGWSALSSTEQHQVLSEMSTITSQMGLLRAVS